MNTSIETTLTLSFARRDSGKPIALACASCGSECGASQRVIPGKFVALCRKNSREGTLIEVTDLGNSLIWKSRRVAADEAKPDYEDSWRWK
jgi:hypothetical protein